jgi:hypothetical protein
MTPLVYVATVGNDVLPVMAGARWLTETAGQPLDQAYLLEDAADDAQWQGQRDRLKDWLERQGAQVSSLTPDELPAVLARPDQRAVVNVTGGRKVLAFGAAATAAEAGAEVIVVDAHAGQQLARICRADGTRLGSVPALTAAEVMAVYVPDAVPASRAPTAKEAAWLDAFRAHPDVARAGPVTLWYWQGQHLALALFGPVLLVLWLPAKSAELADQTALRAFSQRRLSVGGQLTRAYVPPSPNKRDQQQRYAQALQLTVLSVEGEPARAAGNAGPAPQAPAAPTLAQVSRSLVVLLGAQPMPTVRALLGAGGSLPERLVLLCGESLDLAQTAGRLKAWARTAAPATQVVVLPVSSRRPGSIARALRLALAASTESTLNLSGGTKLMGLEALQEALAWPAVRLSVTEGHQLLSLLGEQVIGTGQPLTLPAAQLLALRGIRLDGQARWVDDAELARLASGVLAHPPPYVASGRPTPTPDAHTTAFWRHWHLVHPEEPAQGLHINLSGLAREYLVWRSACQLFPAAEVLSGVHFSFLSWDAATGQDEALPVAQGNVTKSPDLLVAHDGELLAVEVKPSLQKALSAQHLEDLDTGRMGTELGRFGRAAIVASRSRDSRQDAFSHQRFSEALSRAGRKVSYWVMEDEAPEPGIRPFAEFAAAFRR